jgi:hypothetical protein
VSPQLQRSNQVRWTRSVLVSVLIVRATM